MSVSRHYWTNHPPGAPCDGWNHHHNYLPVHWRTWRKAYRKTYGQICVYCGHQIETGTKVGMKSPKGIGKSQIGPAGGSAVIFAEYFWSEHEPRRESTCKHFYPPTDRAIMRLQLWHCENCGRYVPWWEMLDWRKIKPCVSSS